MKKNKCGVILPIVLILLINIGAKSQEIDINKSIPKIRRQYGQIVNKKIDNLIIDTVDLSYYQTQKEFEEEPGGSGVNKYIIYYNEKDTFLIRNIRIQDEGGAYSSRKAEVFFWNNTPFFYYTESESLWGGIMEETRIYIENNKVIRKLHKQATFYSQTSGYIDVSLDTIPNNTMKIEEIDYKDVMNFVNRSRLEINDYRK